MFNLILFGLFIVIVFFTFMSLVFNIVGIFFDEKKLFLTVKSAMILYIATGIIAAVLTFICCYILSAIQLLA